VTRTDPVVETAPQREPVAAPPSASGRARTRWWVGGGLVGAVALAGGLWVGLGNRGDDEEEEDGRIEWDVASSDPAPAPPRPSELTIPKRKGDDSGFPRAAYVLPEDTRFMLGLRWRVLRQDPLFASLFDEVENQLSFLPLRLLESQCQIDLVDDMDWIVLGGGRDEEVALVASGTWTREQVEGCLSAVKGEGTVRRDGAITELVDDSGGFVFGLAWVGDAAFAMSTSDEATREWLDARLEPAAASESLALYQAQELAPAQAWLLSSRDFQPVMTELRLDPEPEGLWGGLALASSEQGLSVAGGLRMASPEDAKITEKTLLDGLEELKDDPMGKLLLSEMSLSAKGTDVFMSAELSPMLTNLLGRLAADAAGEE
jgi:hypothetical protein